MAFLSRRTSCKPIFKELQILTVPSLYIFKTLLFVKSNFHTICDSQTKHNHNTRFKNDLQYPIHRLQLVEKSPQYMGKKFFNNLPEKLKKSILTKSFQSSLTEFLLAKNYYSTSEFLNDKNK